MMRAWHKGLAPFGAGCYSFDRLYISFGASQMARLKNLPVMQDTRLCSLGQEDPDLPRGGNGQPTPVFLPGESHGQRCLVGHSPWG